MGEFIGCISPRKAENTSSPRCKPPTSNPPRALALPWRTRAAVSFIERSFDLSARDNGADCTVNRCLINFINIKASPNPNPINGVKTIDVTVDPSRKLWFRVFIPTDAAAAANSNSLPVVLYFNGGGFGYLNANTKIFDSVCRRFASKVSAIVVSVDYRHSPEHRYPAQYDDGFDALKFLDTDGPKYLPKNADFSRCFIAGDSAGGNLAHHVAISACHFNFQLLKVVGLMAIQPFFGSNERTESEMTLEETPLISVKRTDWLWKAFLPSGEDADRDHPSINVSGPKAIDISTLEYPPTLLFVAGCDMLVDGQIGYYKWLKKYDKQVHLVDYPNAIHAFKELPESEMMFSEVREFVHKGYKVLGSS